MKLNRANSRAGDACASACACNGDLCKHIRLQRPPPCKHKRLHKPGPGFRRGGGVLGRFSAKFGPQTRLARHGSSCNAGCIKSLRSKSRTCVSVCSGAVRRDPEEQGRNPRNTHPEVLHLRNCRKTDPNLARAFLCAPGRSGEIRMSKAIPMG